MQLRPLRSFLASLASAALRALAGNYGGGCAGGGCFLWILGLDINEPGRDPDCERCDEDSEPG